MKKFSLILAIVLLLLMAMPVLAQGSAEVIIVDPQDDPLQISGWLDEENSFSGVFRLSISPDAKEDVKFSFLPYELNLENSDVRIERDNVRVTGDLVLQPGSPKDFVITIKEVQTAGYYTGTIAILEEGKPLKDAVVVNVELTAKDRPQVALLTGSETLSLNLVNCSSCFLGSVLPQSAFLDQWELQIENKSATDAIIEKFEIVGMGEKSGFQLTKDQIELPGKAQELAALQISSIPLKIVRAQIPADHYTGKIYLTLKDKDEFVVVPFDFHVRKGPGLALILLLIGVVLGWFARYMESTGKPLAAELEALDRLQARVDVLDMGDRQILIPMIKSARKLAYQQNHAAAKVSREIVESRMQILVRVRDVQKFVEKVKPENLKAFQDVIAKVRECIELKDDATAALQLEKLNKLVNPPKPGEGEEQRQEQVMGSEVQAEEQIREETIPDEEREQVSLLVLQAQAALSWLIVQSQELEEAISWLPNLTEWRDMLWSQLLYRVLRPLFYLLLLAGLLAVGLNTLYVDANPTFGAAPFSDYFALIVWGLSADVAGTTLTNLTGGNEGKK